MRNFVIVLRRLQSYDRRRFDVVIHALGVSETLAPLRLTQVKVNDSLHGSGSRLSIPLKAWHKRIVV